MESPDKKHEEERAAICEKIRKVDPLTHRCGRNEHSMLLRITARPNAPIGPHEWERTVVTFGEIDISEFLGYAKIWRHTISPRATYARLQPSVAVSAAKNRARRVILTLMLVGQRAGWPWAPQEIWQRILGIVNKEEYGL